MLKWYQWLMHKKVKKMMIKQKDTSNLKIDLSKNAMA